MKISRLFGGKKKDNAKSTSDALQKLCETEETLFKKQNILEQKIKNELSLAKKHGTSNKRLALQALRRKREYEKQLDFIGGVLNSIQQQKFSLENAVTNTEVLKTLSATSKSVMLAYNGKSVDQIHNVLEDIAEQQGLADEVSQAISKPIGAQIDMDELLTELEQLENEDLDIKLLDIEPALHDLAKLNVDQPTHSKIFDKANDKEISMLLEWSQAS